MNIKEIYRTLEAALPYLKLSKYIYENEPKYDYIFHNTDDYRRGYKAIKNVSSFLISPQVAKVLKPIVDSTSTTYPCLKAEGDSIQVLADYLEASANDYYEYLTNLLVNESSTEIIDVKLVDIKSLDELEKSIKLLRLSFNTPVYKLGGEVSIDKVESGSIWITLLIVGTGGAALKLCASIIWSGTVIRNQEAKAKKAEDNYKKEHAHIDLINALQKHNTEYLREIRETEVRHIIKDFLADKDTSETSTEINASLDAVTTLLDRGTEFYPSIEAPKEIKELFPHLKASNLIESKTKLLNTGEGPAPTDN